LLAVREKVLADCPPEKAFWNTNGVVCRNIFELVNNISAMDDRAFRYHVNNDHTKNDFANWIRDVLEDNVLANQLQGILDKDRYIDIINQRIKDLQTADNSA